MKKQIALIFAFFVVFTYANAQENLFQKGDKVVNVGLGLGTTLYSGTGYSSTIPPVSVSAEFGVKDDLFGKANLGVGGYLGIAGSEYKFSMLGSEYGWKYTYIIVGARGVLHYPLVDKLDTYGGLLLGYNVVSASEFGNVPMGFSASTGGLAYAGFIGARYYFTEKIGAMAELGYGISYLNIGLAIKL